MTVYRPPRRRRRRLVWIAAAAVVIGGGVLGSGAWLVRAESGRIPPGVQIGGIEVGGRTPAEARALLEARAEAALERSVRLVYPGGEIVTSGDDLGAKARIEGAIEQAVSSREALDRLTARLGLADPVQIPLTFAVDRGRLAKVLRRVERRVERPARPASIELAGLQATVVPGEAGLELDRAAAAAALATLPARVELALREVPPPVTDAAAERAKILVDTLLAGPPAVVFRKAVYRPPATLLAGALRFRSGEGAIDVSLDPAALERPLRRRFRAQEREPRDAGFRIHGSRVTVVPSREGRRIDVARTAAALVENAGASRIRALFDKAPPQLTTRAAERLRIRELVSEFTTQYPCCAPRVTNIQLAARILDGSIIKPGARFDLNKRLGRRTAERGFVPAPTIYDGRLRDDVGGGVSQIATTLYNAAFFAGLELIAHTPHQFYISRYPMGREATVSWGGPELVFRNDWPAGILVKAIATDTSITFRFYSSKLGRRVETETGEPYDFQPARVIRELNPKLAPGQEVVAQNGGIEGFSVDYTRRVYRGKKLIRDEDFHVRYEPENTIVEYGPPAPAPPPPETPPAEQPGETAPAEQPGETTPAPAETGSQAGDASS